jgi:hypothetical protein
VLRRAARAATRKAEYYCPPKFRLRPKSTRTPPLRLIDRKEIELTQ